MGASDLFRIGQEDGAEGHGKACRIRREKQDERHAWRATLDQMCATGGGRLWSGPDADRAETLRLSLREGLTDQEGTDSPSECRLTKRGSTHQDPQGLTEREGLML